MSDTSADGIDRSHHYTDNPWCDWCDEMFEDRDEVVALTWEFPSSDITVTFCSDECATEWDCSKSRKERQEVIVHV